MAMYNVTLFRDVASNCNVSFQTGTMFLVLRNKMQYSIQSELHYIAETNKDVADITVSSSCMARSTRSENDVIYLLDKKVELLLLRHYFNTF